MPRTRYCRLVNCGLSTEFGRQGLIQHLFQSFKPFNPPDPVRGPFKSLRNQHGLQKLEVHFPLGVREKISKFFVMIRSNADNVGASWLDPPHS
jgi:hypothetical protein